MKIFVVSNLNLFSRQAFQSFLKFRLQFESSNGEIVPYFFGLFTGNALMGMMEPTDLVRVDQLALFLGIAVNVMQ